jgi:N utilization substance protein B
MSRRAARKAALQVLFQIDMGKVSLAEAISFVEEENGLNEKQREFLSALVKGVIDNFDEINGIIKEVAIDWDIDRMAAVDRNILRLALYEICYSNEVPPNVATNEGIELGKTFSTDESGKFINGILGKVLVSLTKYRKELPLPS